MSLSPCKVAVLVSGGGSNLQALLDAEAAGKLLCCKIRLVLSDRAGARALCRARHAGVANQCFDRHSLGWPVAEQAILEALQAQDIEVVVLAGFLSILSADFLKKLNRPVLNIHPSLIPAFCGPGYYGLKVHQAALARGVKLTGATVHLVNEEADGGPILAQQAVPVLEGDTPKSLQRRVMEQAEWQLLPAALEQFCHQRICKGDRNDELS